MGQWLRDWGVLLVAVAALIQPWLITLWRRFFRQGHIDIYEAGLIEIGYSAFGPTIGLQGSIHVLHQNIFVRSAEIRLTRVRDQAKHVFQWGVFRSPILFPQQGTLQLCSGTSLSRDSATQYNIQFWDRDTQEQMRPTIDSVREAWMAELVPVGSPASLDASIVQAIYATFSQTHLHVNAFTTLERLCYWEAGDYTLELRVETARPSNTFVKTWKFNLTARDASFVRVNALAIVLDACGQLRTPWHFAYPQYIPA